MSDDVKVLRHTFVEGVRLLASLFLAVAPYETYYRSARADEQTIAQALEAAKRAPAAATEKLQSAIGLGQFSMRVQHKGEDEPKLLTKATVQVYFDHGKYHIQFGYETKEGRAVPAGAEDVHVITDDDAVYAIGFSPRINPTGCSGEIYSPVELRDALGTSGFPWNDPARLWRDLPDIGATIKNRGADAIAFSEIGGGHFRATYPVYGPYVEIDIDRAAEFNVVGWRASNPKQKNPVQRNEATWKRTGDAWYVAKIVEQRDNREVEPERGNFSRSTFVYDSFEANVKVEPNLFSLQSVPIPPRTRFIDRRPKPASQFQYWNGTALQTERP